MCNIYNSWTAKQFIANLNPVVVRHSKDEDGVSVCVKTSKGKKAICFWIDYWLRDGEITYDWNQYIFHTTDEDDCLRMEMQDNNLFWELMTEAGLHYIYEHGLL